ncbi:hypothetical protein [Croceimicrobium sp.]|uniref:hypothetical protein n=1 Tax=Croceimicrobium sp. TaxID=2828340 RepID=UPI003BA92942
MKVLLVQLIFISFHLSLIGQSPRITARHDYLYQGLANPLSINKHNIAFDSFIFEVDNGLLEIDSSIMTAYPVNIGPWKMKIYQIENGDSILVDSLLTEVRKIPDPIPSIYMRREGVFSKNAIAAAKMESSIHSSKILACGLRFPILTYDIVAFRNHEILWEVTNEGARITDSNKEQILTLESGDLISFTNILGLNAYDEENVLTPFQVEIQ